jgi:dCMP deaminase
MILGVSGPYASGKGEVVAFLKERSFVAHSLSDLIRRELSDQGLEETRERMIETGNSIRGAEGAGALARRLLPELLKERNYVVDSIRHPAEVEVLREVGERFRLIWVDADEATRLKRIRGRGRAGDPESIVELRSLEGRELESGDPAGQQLLAVRSLADEILDNNGSIEQLHQAIHAILKKSLYFERPGWDDYFMSIARVVAMRSNCVKRKVAAVVTLDRRIISTGYNGTPRGVRNCNEGGCPRCNSFAPTGTSIGECLCSHAEENAITQAAYHGVSVRGASLYTTLCPCLMCTKMIINSGIVEVVYNADYPVGDVSLGLLREAGIKVRQLRISS